MKKYNWSEFKNDPRTYLNRGTSTFIKCIDNNVYDIEKIFIAIDNAYKTGKRRNPSHIKDQKRAAVKLLENINFDK